MPLDIQFQLVIEAMLEFGRIDREFREVRLEDRALRKRVTKIDRGVGGAEQQFGFRGDIPEILHAQAVEAVREFVPSAERQHIVTIRFFIEQFVGVCFIGAPINQDGMLARLVQRKGHVAIDLAGLERPRIDAELAFLRAVRTLCLHAHDPQAAIRSEIQAVAAAIDFDAFDHAGINGRCRPEVFQRG